MIDSLGRACHGSVARMKPGQGRPPMAKPPQDDERAMRARLDALKGKLERRAAETRVRAAAASPPGGGFGGPAVTLGLQAGAEFVAAILLGGAIGWGLDRLLGTRPWLLIGFFLLGTVAGVKNVIRVTSPKGRDEVRNSPLSGGQAPDKDEPRPASKAAPQAPSGWDEDED
jgi:ATP synthase protein I